MKERLFCLFVHVGRFLPDKADMLIMPLGLPMLAGFLNDRGFPSRVFNLSVSIIEKGPSLEDIIRKYDPVMVLFSLQWYQQLPYVLDELNRIRKIFPDILITLGGYTASYFAENILKMKSSPDFVIRGDGELPLLELCKVISSKNNHFHKVSNLAWREGGRIVLNPITYIADQKFISELNYARYDLVLNNKYAPMGPVHISDPENDLIHDSRNKTVFYNPGRGCSCNCPFCGGSLKSQLNINGRHGYVFKKTDSALKDIRGFLSQGFSRVYIGFDPEAGGKWYIDFFKAIQSAHINIAVIFESWGIPSKNLTDAFYAAFQNNLENSAIIISPDSGSEKVRKLNKSRFYTNNALEESVRYCVSLGIPVKMFFASCLPGQTLEDLQETVRLVRYYDNICDVDISSISIDPCSLMYENPMDYGIKTNCSFETLLKKRDDDVNWEMCDSKWGTVEKLEKYIKAKKNRI